MDEYTVSTLSNQAVRLLFALILTKPEHKALANGQTVITLSRSELMKRARLDRNTITVAKRELNLKGFIDYEGGTITLKDNPISMGRTMEEIIAHPAPQGPMEPFPVDESTILDGLFSPIRTPREMCEQAKTPEERDDAVVAAFSQFFPDEQSKYPLQKQMVRTWLSLAHGSTQQIYDTMESVVPRKPNHPKGYITSVLKSKPASSVVEEESYVPDEKELEGLRKLQEVMNGKGKDKRTGGHELVGRGTRSPR